MQPQGKGVTHSAMWVEIWPWDKLLSSLLPHQHPHGKKTAPGGEGNDEDNAGGCEVCKSQPPCMNGSSFFKYKKMSGCHLVSLHISATYCLTLAFSTYIPLNMGVEQINSQLTCVKTSFQWLTSSDLRVKQQQIQHDGLIFLSASLQSWAETRRHMVVMSAHTSLVAAKVTSNLLYFANLIRHSTGQLTKTCKFKHECY